MICEKCGAKNASNANFCKECGSPLKEEKKEVIESKEKVLLNSFWNLIKGIFVNPIDTIKKYINEDNCMNSLLLLGVNVLVFGICVIILISQWISTLITTLNSTFYGLTFASYLSPYSSELSEIPYFKIFITTIVINIIAYVGIVGFIYLITKYIRKDNNSFKKLVTWLGANSVLMTIMYIVILIFGLINLQIGVVLLIITSIVYTYNLNRTLSFSIETDENKIPYVLVAAYILTSLIISIFFI